MTCCGSHVHEHLPRIVPSYFYRLMCLQLSRANTQMYIFSRRNPDHNVCVGVSVIRNDTPEDSDTDQIFLTVLMDRFCPAEASDYLRLCCLWEHVGHRFPSACAWMCSHVCARERVENRGGDSDRVCVCVCVWTIHTRPPTRSCSG